MKKKGKISIKTVSATLVGILVLTLIVVVSPIGPSFNQITRPIQNTIYNAGQYIRERALFADSISEVVSENNELEEKVSTLEEKLLEFERLKEENSSLRDQLEFTNTHDLKYVGADVISYQTDGARQTLRIKAGSNRGIEKEMVVISRGHVIGLVQEVHSTESSVRLITDPSFRVSAIVKENEAQGLVQGRLGGSVIMDKIPQFEIPTVGDQVLTSGLGEKVPDNLRIGTISAVSENPDSVFAQAQVETPFDPRTVKTVLVIKE